MRFSQCVSTSRTLLHRTRAKAYVPGTFAGVATTYSFSSSRHAGFALDDLVFLRYSGARAAPVIR